MFWFDVKYLEVVKIFPHPNYRRDSASFFPGFEVSFVTWIHLGSSSCISQTLRVCVCI